MRCDVLLASRVQTATTTITSVSV